MKAVIYVFSGTGNTMLVAQLYKQFLSSYETVIHRLGFGEVPSSSDADLIGFAYPIHGFNAPKVMVDFCRSMPSVGKKGERVKRCFVFKTSGEGLSFNNYSSQKMIKILEKRGLELMLLLHFTIKFLFLHKDKTRI